MPAKQHNACKVRAGCNLVGLPTILISEILRFLPIHQCFLLRSVNSLMATACDLLLSTAKILDLSACFETCDEDSLTTIIRTTACLHTLNLTQAFVQPSDILYALVHCRSLKHLCITLAQRRIISYTLSAISLLETKPFSLVEFSVRGCEVLSIDTISSIINQCPLLEVLNLSCISTVSDSLIYGATRSCPSIRILRLNKCPGISYLSFEFMAISWSSLETLEVNMCCQLSLNAYRDSRGGTTDTSLSLFSSPTCRVAKLRELGISLNPHITSNGILSLLARESLTMWLEDLDLGFLVLLSNDVIIEISRVCKALKRLSLCRIDNVLDSGVVAILRGCPYLQLLNLRKCSSVTPSAFSNISRFGHSLKALQCDKMYITDYNMLRRRGVSVISSPIIDI